MADATDADGSGPRPTLAAVAARVGVSRTTVSNAYNRPDQLSAEMRGRILTAAAQLGYAGPDPVARSLRTRTAGAVGLIFSDRLSSAFGDPAAVEFLQGVAEACEQRDRSLLLIPAGPRASNVDLVARAGVDGFVVFSMPAGDPHVESVLSRPQAAVVVDSPRGVDGVDFVGVDDRTAFQGVVDHVLALGHRRLGVVAASCGETEHAGWAAGIAQPYPSSVLRERLAGLADALGEYGRDSSTVPIWLAATHSLTSGRVGAAALLTADPTLTAIVCASDALALGVLDELAERGIAVPRTVSVTGFDDVPAAAAAGLTTVHQPTRDKGRQAGELLLDPRPRAGPRRRELPTRLVVRTTTAPPAHRQEE